MWRDYVQPHRTLRKSNLIKFIHKPSTKSAPDMSQVYEECDGGDRKSGNEIFKSEKYEIKRTCKLRVIIRFLKTCLRMKKSSIRDCLLSVSGASLSEASHNYYSAKDPTFHNGDKYSRNIAVTLYASPDFTGIRNVG